MKYRFCFRLTSLWPDSIDVSLLYALIGESALFLCVPFFLYFFVILELVARFIRLLVIYLNIITLEGT